jgi:hypothetical protein
MDEKVERENRVQLGDEQRYRVNFIGGYNRFYMEAVRFMVHN